MCREIPISYTHSIMRLYEEASPILNNTYIISSPCPMLSKSRLESNVRGPSAKGNSLANYVGAKKEKEQKKKRIINEIPCLRFHAA